MWLPSRWRLAGLALARRWRRAFIVGILGVGLLAFASSGWRAAARQQDGLLPVLEGRDVQVVGVVASLPQLRATNALLRFALERAIASCPGS